MALAWSWEGKKAEPQLPTCLKKGNSFLPVPLLFVGLQQQGKIYVPLRLFFLNSQLWQLHSWCEEASKRNKRRRMLNSVCPVSTFYAISKQTLKKLHYCHADQVHLAKYTEEGNYCRTKRYYLALGRYLSIP